MTRVELSHLTKIYQNSIIFDNVNLHVPAGKAVAIQGKSGVGKSTLLNIIAGLENPSSGTYKINGVDLTGKSARELSKVRKESIGYISQHCPMIPNLTALENILVPVYFKKLKVEGEVDRWARELGDMLDVGHLFQKNINMLSGGEIQRIGIIRAVVHHPAILIADEPTASLDQETSDLVLHCFNQLKRNGMSIIMATHRSEAAKSCNDVYQLSKNGLHEVKGL